VIKGYCNVKLTKVPNNNVIWYVVFSCIEDLQLFIHIYLYCCCCCSIVKSYDKHLVESNQIWTIYGGKSSQIERLSVFIISS